MIFNLRNTIGARKGIITEDSFSFAGDYLFIADEDGNFELALLESGSLEWFVDPGAVDLFLVLPPSPPLPELMNESLYIQPPEPPPEKNAVPPS